MEDKIINIKEFKKAFWNYIGKHGIVVNNGNIDYVVEQVLKEYEDLEEQGLIVRLPCKVGDKVYIPYSSFNEIEEWQVVSFHTYENIVLRLRNFKNEYIALDIKNLGKEWFLTRAEAEKKLKELKGEE